MNIKESIQELKLKFPEVISMMVSYQGSGDSFDSFWNFDTSTVGNKETLINEKDVEDLLWYAIDNSEANFNNEGSEGKITIDFENETLSINNYYIVYEKYPSGEITFE